MDNYVYYTIRKQKVQALVVEVMLFMDKIIRFVVTRTEYIIRQQIIRISRGGNVNEETQNSSD